jgi:hypothetical protein
LLYHAGLRLELVRAYVTDLLPEDLQAEVRIGAAGGSGRASEKVLWVDI